MGFPRKSMDSSSTPRIFRVFVLRFFSLPGMLAQRCIIVCDNKMFCETGELEDLYPIWDDSTSVCRFDRGPDVAIAVLLMNVAVGSKTNRQIDNEKNEGDLRNVSDN